RFVEQQDVFFAFVLFQFLFDVLIRCGEIAIKERRTNRLKPVEVSTATGHRYQQRKYCARPDSQNKSASQYTGKSAWRGSLGIHRHLEKYPLEYQPDP
ncbi:MAG: hypothetical protein WCH39_17440, partial [Schlesneria sp.]